MTEGQGESGGEKLKRETQVQNAARWVFVTVAPNRSFIEVVSPTGFRHCRERRLTGNIRLPLIPLISLRYTRYARQAGEAAGEGSGDYPAGAGDRCAAVENRSSIVFGRSARSYGDKLPRYSSLIARNRESV